MDLKYSIDNPAETKKKISPEFYVIARRLKHLRKIYNMTQSELGRRTGIGATSISSYEKPYCEIPFDNLRIIAELFNLEISYFTSDGVSDNIALRLYQRKSCNQYIPYYDITNTNGILHNDDKIADGCLTLPKPMIQGTNVICTEIPDNSLINLQYKRGEMIIVDLDARPETGSVALLYDTAEKKMIIRKYMCEGPMVTLMSDGHGDNLPIYTDITDNNYILIGPVIRSTRDC